MKRHVLLFVLLVALVSALGSCRNGGSGDSTDGGNAGDNTGSPVIPGFSLSLKQGDYWEYRWDVQRSSGSVYGGSSGTSTGMFRITLGEPFVIGDMTAFPLLLSGNYRQGGDAGDAFVYPRWSYLAVSDGKIMLSSDGADFKTVFDATNGYVMGFGFFTELGSGNLFEIGPGDVSNDYIVASDSVYVISDAASESRCEYFASYGTICGASGSVDYQLVRREYYQAGVGPVAYYYYFGATTGGTFDSVSTSTTINIGLVSSSLRGDAVTYMLETEPNNTPQTATPVTGLAIAPGASFSLKGDVSASMDIATRDPANFATSYLYYLRNRTETEPNDGSFQAQQVSMDDTVHGRAVVGDSGDTGFVNVGNTSVLVTIEDWYRFDISTQMAADYAGTFPFDIALEFYPSMTTADFNLYVFDTTGNLVEYSNYNNIRDDIGYEYIHADLPAGSYYIGVDADNVNAVTDYALTLYRKLKGGIYQINSNAFPVVDFYRLTLTAASRLQIQCTPAYAVFVADVSGSDVLASSGLNGAVDQGRLLTPVLQPGDYLIAVGVNISLDTDTYELSVQVQ